MLSANEDTSTLPFDFCAVIIYYNPLFHFNKYLYLDFDDQTKTNPFVPARQSSSSSFERRIVVIQHPVYLAWVALVLKEAMVQQLVVVVPPGP